MNLFTQYCSRTLRMALVASMTMSCNWMASYGLAQEQGAVAIPVVGGVGMAMPSMGKITGAKHYQLQQIFSIEIRRIDKATKLDDAQKTKLTVGAKGVAKKLAQDFGTTLGDMMAMGPDIGGNLGGPVGVPPKKTNAKAKEVQMEEVKKLADIDPNVMMMLETPTPNKPTEDPSWTKIVKSVLTPDQHTKFEQVRAADKEKTDRAIAEAGVAGLSAEIFLSKDQEAKLIALILEQMKKPKEKSTSLLDGGMLPMEGMAFYSKLVEIDSKRLQEVLDPQQFELTEFKLTQTREMLRSFGQVGDTFIIEK